MLSIFTRVTKCTKINLKEKKNVLVYEKEGLKYSRTIATGRDGKQTYNPCISVVKLKTNLLIIQPHSFPNKFWAE